MDATILDRIPESLRAISSGLEPAMIAAALSILGVVFAAQFSWGLVENILRKSNITDYAAFVAKEFTVIGFFAGLTKGGAELANALIEAFQNTAATASGFTGTMSPSAIIATAMNLGNGLLKSASLWNAPEVYLFAAVIIGCFCVIAGLIVLALVEAAFVVYGGILWLGFGGSRWTREMALSMVRYVFSVGAKLFTLQLLVGFGSLYTTNAIGDFNNMANLASSDCVVAAAVAIVMLMLALRLPETVQSFVGGASLTGMHSLMHAAHFMNGAVGHAAAAITTAVGAGMLAKNAHALTSANRAAKALGGTGAMPGMKSVQASGNVLKGIGETLHNRAAGRTTPHASLLVQTAANMGDKARQQRIENSSPRP